MSHPETERYYTPKLSLLAPSIDDEISSCRPNWERLDEAYAGALVVSTGTVPDESILFDGCLVAERNTGIVWRAQRNASGVFEKRYVKYPWRASFTQDQTYPSGGTAVWGAWGYQTVEGGSINAGNESLVNNRLVIPVTGIYQGADWMKWTDSAVAGSNTGVRSHTLWVNDLVTPVVNPEFTWYEESVVPTQVNNVCTTCVRINRLFNAGDTVCAAIWQNSTVALPNTHRIMLALVRPVGG
jgi:hypothetical protein